MGRQLQAQPHSRTRSSSSLGWVGPARRCGVAWVERPWGSGSMVSCVCNCANPLLADTHSALCFQAMCSTLHSVLLYSQVLDVCAWQ
jgi:hypothetical protein